MGVIFLIYAFLIYTHSFREISRAYNKGLVYPQLQFSARNLQPSYKKGKGRGGGERKGKSVVKKTDVQKCTILFFML